jgi:hypothetical protein
MPENDAFVSRTDKNSIALTPPDLSASARDSSMAITAERLGDLGVAAVSERPIAPPQDLGRERGIAEVDGQRSLAAGDARDPKRSS